MSWTNAVRREYEVPGRYYHNWDHIRDCLGLLLPLSDKIPLFDWLCIRYALLGHDRVYDTRAKDNEEESARLTELDLRALDERDETVKEVVRLILLTKDHNPEPGDERGEIMCDIDCAILAAPEDDYDDYASGVRMEYAWVNDEDWKAGRSAVLTNFLARPRIFRSAHFYYLEESARRNLTQELESLQ